MASYSVIDLVDSESDDDSCVARRRRTKRKAALPTRRSKRTRSSKKKTSDNDEELVLLSPSNVERGCGVCKMGETDDEDESYNNIPHSVSEDSLVAIVDDDRKPAARKRASSRRALQHVDGGNNEKEGDVNILPSVVRKQSLVANVEDRKPSARKQASSASTSSYLRSLRENVKKRTFPLSEIPTHDKISTGRTIKKMKAWQGTWPPLREFMQNTIDHLGLIDVKTGRRRECIDLNVSKSDTKHQSSSIATFSFTCGQQDVCKIEISRDEIIIDQLYTYPLASRALDTGVPDTTKFASTNTNQAGGFGDGFKTAAVALIANSKDCDFNALKWYFYALEEKTKIEWNFEGLTREKIATFAKCKVLEVKIDKANMDSEEFNQLFPSDTSKEAEKENAKESTIEDGKKYVMRQVIQVIGIGQNFMKQVLPRLTVFWDLDEQSLISMKSRGGDFIGPASSQPALFGGILGEHIKAESGIYVRGIWVRPAKIQDTIMCFYGNRLEVTGRDRNEVDEDMLVDAVVYILQRCNDLHYLRELLEPLRGNMELESEPPTKTRLKKVGQSKTSKSWLLKSPRFFNRVIESQKDFILYDVFGIAKGAIFVSSKTTKSKDPFINWAATFLKKNGTPLVSIEKGAHRYLFEEVNHSELTDRCVQILKRDIKLRGKDGTSCNIIQPFFRKLFTFMGIGKAKVFFSRDVAIAFVHNSSIYIPEAKLSRELIVRVLNVCNSYLVGTDAESYSCLMQAIFETLPATIAGGDITILLKDAQKLVDRAKQVQRENETFMSGSAGKITSAHDEQDNNTVVKHQEKGRRRGALKIDDVDAIDLTSGDEEVINNNDNNNTSEMEEMVQERDELERQIERASRLTSHVEDNGIIPNSDFADDNAGDHDPCLRPSSTLQKVRIGDGPSLYCDTITAAAIKRGEWERTDKLAKVNQLRSLLQEAIGIVRESTPSLNVLLNNRVHAGYDGQNSTYEGFCNGQTIIINLFAYLPKLSSSSSLTERLRQNLIHDLVVVVTHELAHFLEPNAGHGPIWRDTHSRMLIQVMNRLKEEERRAR